MKYTLMNKNDMDGMLKLWNKEIGDLFPMRRELFVQNSMQDENVLNKGSWLVKEEGTVVGFVISKIWQEKSRDVQLSPGVGWIQVLIVDSDYRNRGIGSSLIERAEEALQKAGAEKILLGADPWHYFPGVPDSFENLGEWFKKKGYQWMRSTYDLYSGEELVEETEFPQLDGVTFELLTLDDETKLIDFLNQSFPGRWMYEAQAYFENGGNGREYVVLKKDDKIIGFCRLNDSQSPIIAQNTYWSPLFQGNMGGIGPLGIDSHYRKRGYGLAIVKAAIHVLQKRGIEDIVIDWTDQLTFYEKLGFKVWKSYSQYEK